MNLLHYTYNNNTYDLTNAIITRQYDSPPKQFFNDPNKWTVGAYTIEVEVEHKVISNSIYRSELTFNYNGNIVCHQSILSVSTDNKLIFAMTYFPAITNPTI